MKTLKSLLEEIKVFNLDTDEELDLDNIDFDAILGDFTSDTDDEDSIDIGDRSLDGYVDDGNFDDEANGQDTDISSINLDDYSSDDISSDEFDPALDTNELDNLEDNQFGIDDAVDEDNPDFQGEIRTVRGANLVFKRKSEDGNFEELWIYNVGKDIKRETQIRRAILAGTDIDPGAQESKDGSQVADTTTVGNVQFLHITGLPQ